MGIDFFFFLSAVFSMLLFNALKECCWFVQYLSNTFGTTVTCFLTLSRITFILTQNFYELIVVLDHLSV